MNGPLYMQNSNNKMLIRRVRRKDDGSLKSLARWLLDNQTGVSFNLIALIFLAHMCLPKARQHTLKFFTLAYQNPSTGTYALGSDDYYFMAFCIVLFTGLRAGVMEYILAPLAKHWGISKPKDVTRFSEQAWMLIYYCVFWPLGLVCLKPSRY
jgi:very-long-chain ceramide synthase